MKPGPFKDVKYEDTATHFKVESILDKKRGDFSSEGTTTVYDKKHKKLWSLKMFVGRKKIELSPDGQTLALIGNFFFGGIVQPSAEEELIHLLNKDGTVKMIRFSDIYKGDVDKFVKGLDDVKGGGWVDIEQLMNSHRIDWKLKTILVESAPEKKAYTFSF